LNTPLPLRTKVAHILAVDGKHKYSRLVDILLISLIILNVIAIILESMETFKARHHGVLAVFDTFSVLVFTVEYALRLWSCVD
jgi:voltage-gated potassium channel